MGPASTIYVLLWCQPSSAQSVCITTLTLHKNFIILIDIKIVWLQINMLSYSTHIYTPEAFLYLTIY